MKREPPELRAMIGRYLSHPDPVAWLAAADWLEEQGRSDEAAVWRRRGELFPPLRRGLTFAGIYHDAVEGCGLKVTFRRLAGWDRVTVSLPNTQHVREYRILRRAVDRRYWTRRLLEIIDDLPRLARRYRREPS